VLGVEGDYNVRYSIKTFNPYKKSTINYLVDNFYKIFHEWEKEKLLRTNKIRHRVGNSNLSELSTIFLYFYLSLCKDFKNYYLYLLAAKYSNHFKLVSYSRIVQFLKKCVIRFCIQRNGKLFTFVSIKLSLYLRNG
jgi:hypothetical protein